MNIRGRSRATEGACRLTSGNSEQVAKLIALMGSPAPECEYRFHSKRKWRYDLAWPNEKIAIEIQGGTFTSGRHTRGLGYAADCEKLNSAQLLGWRCYWVPSEWWNNGLAWKLLDEIFDAKK